MSALFSRGRCLVAWAIGLLSSQAWSVDLPEVISRMKPSVALVGVYSPTDSPRFTFRGTGFVVGDGNQLVTNAHVLPESVVGEGAKQLAIQLWTPPNQWEMRLATLLSRDSAHDLALLSFPGSAVRALTLESLTAREGQSIAFMGFPIGGALGFSHVTHRGLISSVAAIALPAPTSQMLNAQAVWQLRRGGFDIYQLDATAYPGNSGGPLFDLESGHVIGVLNSVLVKSNRESALTHPTGISYGIPARHVMRLLEEKR